jgi:glycosyl transferase family 4
MNRRGRPRSLAGATILQLVPALRDDPAGHAAVEIARTLVQAGARAIVAGDGGPLAAKLRSFGAEWLPMIAGSFNPFRIRANARTIAHLIAAERVDIVHAQHAAAAWSALRATQAAGVPRHLVCRPTAVEPLAGADAACLACARPAP